jgi:hypothetical protein
MRPVIRIGSWQTVPAETYPDRSHLRALSRFSAA